MEGIDELRGRRRLRFFIAWLGATVGLPLALLLWFRIQNGPFPWFLLGVGVIPVIVIALMPGAVLELLVLERSMRGGRRLPLGGGVVGGAVVGGAVLAAYFATLRIGLAAWSALTNPAASGYDASPQIIQAAVFAAVVGAVAGAATAWDRG
ncbi:MAG TPA: hypothetical protein VH440_12130 [Candidatus Limnocylindrales bacterium]